MTAPALANQKLSYEEYLLLEENSEVRHEYFYGEVYAMAGTIVRHNIIAVNTLLALRTRLTGCLVTIESVKVQITPRKHYVYPDVIVSCDPRENDPHSILYPVIIVEVLSEGTQDYDRTLKFEHYKKIPSLQHYVLISQKFCIVECFTRQGEQWVHHCYMHPDNLLEVAGIQIPLAEIYRGVDLEPMKSEIFTDD